MKHALITLCFSILLITGCVNIHTIKDFKSPQEFYNKINEEVNDRTVKVVTDSNEVYDADKLTISPDSIFFEAQGLERLEYKSAYSNSEIKDMEQTDYYYTGEIIHKILLNNGDLITSKDMLIKNDSVFLYDIIPEMSMTKTNISLSTTGVNSISYNNRLIGMGEGAYLYALAGILFGIKEADHIADQTESSPQSGAVAGAIVFGLVGAIAGAVVGTVTGSYQDYIINEPEYDYHGLTSIELVGGICSSYMGFTFNGNNSLAGSYVDFTAGLSLV
jgi:hypothetical protein